MQTKHKKVIIIILFIWKQTQSFALEGHWYMLGIITTHSGKVGLFIRVAL